MRSAAHSYIHRIRVARLSQLYLTLGMLLEGGIPIMTALEMLRASSPPALARSLEAASSTVSAGGSVSQGFDAQGLATPIALRCSIHKSAGHRLSRDFAALQQINRSPRCSC